MADVPDGSPAPRGSLIPSDVRIVPGSAFEDCTFRGTNLQGADLSACRFVDCTFVEANLSLARLAGASFRGVVFRECKLAGVDWTQAARLVSVTFETSVLDDGAFMRLPLKGAVLRECRARRAVFTETDLRESDLSGTDFTGATFGATKLAGANLRRAIGYWIDPTQNDLRGASVSLPEAATLIAALGVLVDDVNG
ncbi:MAG: pentapeptide repeat-containing protein [Planctomycetes bacterium]|nr:pentapeptide repeat-containing protein [Planctomycetota bacterium]